MRKLLFLCCALVITVITSCTNDEPISNNVEADVTSENNESKIRTIEDAISIASQNYGNLFDMPASRCGLNIDPNNVVVLGSKAASRSGASDTAIYVVNFGDNKGYAVVSANKECTPLLAMTDNGEITNIDSIEIPGLKTFMKGAVAYSSGGSNVIIPPTKPGDDGREPLLYFGEVVEDEYYSYGRGVDVNWGQNWPEGYFWPNKISGCVITAGLQAFSQVEYPKSIKLTYSDRDQENLVLDWSAIKKNVVSKRFYPKNIENISNLDSHLDLARLSREIGYRIKANPDSTGTSSNLRKLRKLLKNIIPEIEISDMCSGAPKVATMHPRWSSIIMEGKENKDSKFGHAWIIDKYKTHIQHVKIYAVEHPLFDIDGNFVPVGEPTSTYDYRIYSLSHINWGWNGSGNGYYDVGVYDLTKCKEPDLSKSSDTTNFEYIIDYFTIYKD